MVGDWVAGFLFHKAEHFGQQPVVTWGSFLGFLVNHS